MTKQFLALTALALVATACAGSTLVTKTADDAGYTSYDQIAEHHDNLGSHHCLTNDVAGYDMHGMLGKRLTDFTVCCGPDREKGCKAVEN